MAVLPHFLCTLAFVLLSRCALGLRSLRRHRANPTAAGNLGYEYYGRFDFSVPGQASFDWPGAYIEGGFMGTSLTVIIAGPLETYFDVFIDGQIMPATNTQGPSWADYGTFRFEGMDGGFFEVATGLSDAAHTFRLVKRSENDSGPVVFKGVYGGPGSSPLPAPDRPALKLEFVGDSNTAGYGVESPSRDDPRNDNQDESGRSCSEFQLNQYTNTDKSWGPIAARILGAQYHVVASSGLGMVRHYNGDTTRPLFEEYYGSTLISQVGATWDFSWTADVVVIRLGTNDFSTPLGANDVGRFANRSDLIAQYKMKYHEFLNIVRNRNPGAQIVNAVTYLSPDDEYRAAVLDVIATEEAAGATDLHYQDFAGATSFGCDWHLDMADQERLGQEIAALIETEILPDEDGSQLAHLSLASALLLLPFSLVLATP